jgi:hypothetical protein
MSCKVRRISFLPPIPLAMYKELAAHLGQISSVSVELQWQNAKNFDYSASQIAAINLSYSQEDVDLVRKILDCYGTWQEQESEVEAVRSNLLFQV